MGNFVPMMRMWTSYVHANAARCFVRWREWRITVRQMRRLGWRDRDWRQRGVFMRHEQREWDTPSSRHDVSQSQIGTGSKEEWRRF